MYLYHERANAIRPYDNGILHKIGFIGKIYPDIRFSIRIKSILRIIGLRFGVCPIALKERHHTGA